MSAVTVIYEQREHLLPVSAGESVRELRATLASALGLPPSELRLAAPGGGAPLADERALHECGLAPADAILATRVTTLRAALARAAALLAEHAPTLLFCGALPLVLYFGLRRRGAPRAAVLGALRLPFAE
jgi:hypothetical protein